MKSIRKAIKNPVKCIVITLLIAVALVAIMCLTLAISNPFVAVSVFMLSVVALIADVIVLLNAVEKYARYAG